MLSSKEKPTPMKRKKKVLSPITDNKTLQNSGELIGTGEINITIKTTSVKF